MSVVDTPDEKPSKRSPMRTVAIVAAVLVAVVALACGAFVFYFVVKDSPDELDESDLAEALAVTTSVATVEAVDTGPTDTSADGTVSATTEAATSADSTVPAGTATDGG